jgi:hypothetical protein
MKEVEKVTAGKKHSAGMYRRGGGEERVKEETRRGQVGIAEAWTRVHHLARACHGAGHVLRKCQLLQKVQASGGWCGWLCTHSRPRPRRGGLRFSLP